MLSLIVFNQINCGNSAECENAEEPGQQRNPFNHRVHALLIAAFAGRRSHGVLTQE